MPFKKLIIAIDGYSSCGKSTVAKALAHKLKLNYIDSGAMYRAVTFYFLRNNIPVPLPEELESSEVDFEKVMHDIEITFKINPETHFSEIYLNGNNAEHEIRTMEISENVSHVSAIRAVRKKLVALQQKMQHHGGLVMDGRDIGTTVFPNADLKIFMVADPGVRAQRRYNELLSKGVKVTFKEVENNIKSRDEEDTHRKISPLRKADDAVILDNSNMNFEEQLDFVMEEISKLKLISK
ncbi:MAG TPA: (d)CMP kinase [Bacteroidia bacterium]|nr:(d)CMP kinase [Bacteroidia bacterium]